MCAVPLANRGSILTQTLKVVEGTAQMNTCAGCHTHSSTMDDFDFEAFVKTLKQFATVNNVIITVEGETETILQP